MRFDEWLIFGWSLPLSSFTYASVFIYPCVISVSIYWALTYARHCGRPLWSRVNPAVPEATKVPRRDSSPFWSSIPMIASILCSFFPLLSTLSDLLLFLCNFLEVLTCYFLFHLRPCLLSTLPSQYFGHISPGWECSDDFNCISHPIARGSFLIRYFVWSGNGILRNRVGVRDAEASGGWLLAIVSFLVFLDFMWTLGFWWHWCVCTCSYTPAPTLPPED